MRFGYDIVSVASLALGLLVAGGPARAASVTVSVDIIGTNCPAFGDPTCAGFAPLPGLPRESNSAAGVAGATVQAGANYIDPRPGTANSANASVVVGPGFLQLTSGASVSSLPPLGQLSPNLQRIAGLAEASFTDRVTISAPSPALQGQTAVVVASLVVSGVLSASGTNANAGGGSLGAANWQVAWGTSTGGSGGSTSNFVTGFFGSVLANTSGSSSQGPALPATIPVQFVIQLGVPFDLTVAARTVAQATVSAGSAKPLTEGITTGTAAALFGNTFAWNGIQSVTRQGQAITGFTVTSESGADYASAIAPTVVPLPGGAWLLGTAAVALVARRKARRSTRLAA